MTRTQEVQAFNYLNELKKEIGLLTNFGPNAVKVRRKYREPKQEQQ